MQQIIKNKHLGVIIILISIVLSLLLVSYNIQFQKHHEKICPAMIAGEECPSMGSLPPSIVAGVIIAILLFVLGTYLISIDISTSSLKHSLKKLDEDENKVYNIILDSDGSVFQGELIKKTGYSKVKISRVLDKLESKKIIERRRRGMSNIIVLT